jgi:uncharacterized protein YdhG (YjbR/CyaY superfamily)
MDAPASVDAYLASVPPGRRAALEQLRATIREAAPDAVETIAYQMPAYRLGGRFLVSFGAFKRHDSLFPASDVVVDALGEELTPYLAGQGTIRFPANGPMPLDLVRRVVEIRVHEMTAADRP